MTINPTQEQHDALEYLLNTAMALNDFEIEQEFETADEAVAAWEKRDEEGNFFRGNAITYALLVWDGYLNVEPAEIIRNRFEDS